MVLVLDGAARWRARNNDHLWLIVVHLCAGWALLLFKKVQSSGLDNWPTARVFVC